MNELDVIRLIDLVAGIGVALIGVCRVNQMHRGRWAYAAAYVLITVVAIGVARGAIWPEHDSPWLRSLLVLALLVLFIDTRGRWANGAPPDTRDAP